MTPLDAETMVASLGLDRILAGTASFTREAQESTFTWPKRARALLLQALARREDPEGDDTDLPAFDWKDTKALLEADDEAVQARTEALYDVLPDDIQDDVEAAATRAIAHLQETFPRRMSKTTARVDVSPPEPYELDRFARAWYVAVDPMHALEAFAAGSLDMVMVEALEALYPEIYKVLATPGGLLDDAIGTMKARRGETWDVTDDQDRQVKILIGADPIDFDLARDFAELAQPAPAPAAKPHGGSVNKPSEELLPGQKA